MTEVDHYLDDYITIGPPDSEECQYNLSTMLEVCRRLGVPLSNEKLEGPSACLTFLGIEIDTSAGVLRLPRAKLTRIRHTLHRWRGWRTCRRRELESLIGLLQHASQVVHPGRSFLRRMINLLCIARSAHHHIRLNHEFTADLWWWQTFLSSWNGIYVFPPADCKRVEFASDASGGWGCGAWWKTEWFQFQWPQQAKEHHITFLELVAVMLACAAWGPQWQGRLVHVWCDNQAAGHAITARSCRDSGLMHLLRCLFFMEASFQFQLSASHIPGVNNILADLLSRNKLPLFLSKVTQANAEPAAIPPQLPQLLLDTKMDWTSPTWTQLFSSFVLKA